MDASTFDWLTVSLAQRRSRRPLLQSVGTAGLLMVLSHFTDLPTEAKHHKHHRHHQHPPRCRHLGETCTVATSPLCCDGLRCDNPFEEKEGTICCLPGGSVCDPTQPEQCCDPYSCAFVGFCATT